MQNPVMIVLNYKSLCTIRGDVYSDMVEMLYPSPDSKLETEKEKDKQRKGKNSVNKEDAQRIC